MIRLFLLFSFLFLSSATLVFSQAHKDPLKEASKEKARIQREKEERLDKIGKAIEQARAFLPSPYKAGGKGKRGVDESGLTMVAYKKAGLDLPHSIAGQMEQGDRKYIGELALGDLVFFSLSPGSKKISHVALVSKIEGGDVYFIFASASAGVKEQKLNEEKWKERYVMARRVLPEVVE